MEPITVLNNGRADHGLILTVHSGEVLEAADFDKDKELSIEVDSGDPRAIIYLSPNQVNALVTHLCKQLQSINEPIEGLSITTA